MYLQICLKLFFQIIISLSIETMHRQQTIFCFLCIAFTITSTELSQHRILQTHGDPSNLEICINSTKLGCNFTQWKINYQVKYPNETSEQEHHLYYCQNCYNIRSTWNNDSLTYKQKESITTGMSLDQANSYLGIRPLQIPDKDAIRVSSATLENQRVGTPNPLSLDYSNFNGKNCLTSVKNQGSCGCCWSFASTAVYEALLRISGFNYQLSVQAALECTSGYSPNHRVSDCSGGYFPDSLTFYAKVGGVLLSSYPYVSGNYGDGPGNPTTPGICTEQNRVYLGPGTKYVYGPLTAEQIKFLLYTQGPLMVGVYANTGFMNYGSGIFSGCPLDSYKYINHAVLLYGYDSNGNWLIKNQWGTGWGNGGYMTLSSTYDCGMNYALGSIVVNDINQNVLVIMNPNYSLYMPQISFSLWFIALLLVICSQ